MKNGECKAITWVTECAMRFRRPSVRLSPSTMSSRRWGHYLVVENRNGRNELELLVKYLYSLWWKLPTTFVISSRYSRQSSSRSWWSLRQTLRMPHIWRQKEQWTGRKETAESERAAKDVWGGEKARKTQERRKIERRRRRGDDACASTATICLHDLTDPTDEDQPCWGDPAFNLTSHLS